MGESIAEATILKWLKSPGDPVEKDETILEISTDKVDSEIPAPASGVLVEVLANEGDTVEVKAVIAIIDSEASEGETASGDSSEKETKKSDDDADAKAPRKESLTEDHGTSDSDDRFYSPLVRSIAGKNDIDDAELGSISGTGTNGRVTKDDLMQYIEGGRKQQQSSKSAPASTAESTGDKDAKAKSPSSPGPTYASLPSGQQSGREVPASHDYGADGRKVVKMDSMRKMIAEHMVRSKATSPHVYSVAEVDVTNIAKWRKANQSTFLGREGFKLSFTPFFLEAVVKGLMEYPQINASVENDNIILKRDINLGCAVALGKDGMGGLIVPVIKNADQLNLTGIARALTDIATRARNKKLTPDDVQGGTFTVTNPGIFGNTISFPIISQPQLAILSLGAIKKRPVVVNNAIAIRDIVMVTLSYDHRAIDGATGGQYLNFVSTYLENWDLNRGV